MSAVALLGGALLLANALSVLLWWRDKRAARLGLRRTPERQLLAVALAGGWPAAWVMSRLLRHKTRKQPFGVLLVLCAVLHATALLLIWRSA